MRPGNINGCAHSCLAVQYHSHCSGTVHISILAWITNPSEENLLLILTCHALIYVMEQCTNSC